MIIILSPLIITTVILVTVSVILMSITFVIAKNKRRKRRMEEGSIPSESSLNEINNFNEITNFHGSPNVLASVMIISAPPPTPSDYNSGNYENVLWKRSNIDGILIDSPSPNRNLPPAA